MKKKAAIPRGARAYLSAIGIKGGKKGGPARARTLTAAERTRIARKAAEARWKGKS